MTGLPRCAPDGIFRAEWPIEDVRVSREQLLILGGGGAFFALLAMIHSTDPGVGASDMQSPPAPPPGPTPVSTRLADLILGAES